jgi:2-iminobutanoate/2-iminopropanoate deaminase
MSAGQPAYSVVRSAGGLVFVSGQLGLDDDGAPTSVATQTRRALERICAALEPVGLTKGGIVSCTVILGSMQDWSAMNLAFEEFFDPPYPSRTAFGGELIGGALVEINAIASSAA